MNFIRLTKIVSVCCFIILPTIACSDKLNEQRSTFLIAEKHLAEKNDTAFLVANENLVDYPLYPYLRYQWLKDHLAQTDPIIVFLLAHKDTRYAPLLRSNWLGYLAEHQRWQEFVQYYEENEHSSDDCTWQWAKYKIGNTSQALVEAKRLWLAGSTNKNCAPLFSALINSLQITPELTWQRFETALINNNITVVRQTLTLLNKAEQAKAEQWLKLHDKPYLLEDSRFWLEKNEQSGQIFAHAITRLSNIDLDRAIALWDLKKAEFVLDNQTAQNVEKKFGMALLGIKDQRAYERLNKITTTDEDVRIAKVRAALLEQNWSHVNSALTRLTAAEQQESKWQYWLARALQETGNTQQANSVYLLLAKDRSFYGFLAADTVNMPYQISDHPVKVDAGAIALLLEEPDFKACNEFKFFNRDLEARRQWQFAVKKLTKEKLLVAAKLAQQWQWDQLAITTLVKADYWDDMALRFPIRYLGEIQTNAEKHNLDPALIMGLMRQESMLDTNVVSSAGARGLMQLMPQTARTLAKEQLQPWLTDRDLFKPDVNINYGSYYLRNLSNRFNGHLAIVSAAYNAGPNRVKKWLPAAASVPADIWIETIPYKETRKYVASVLSNAIIYQARLNKSALKLKSLLRDVPPA